MASLFLFLGGFRNMSPATAVLFRFPQPARANQSGLCLEHHPSPSHNLLRHGDPFHRCLSGILAWRSVLLTGFRHGDPAHRHFRGIPVWRMASRPVHDRQLTDALTGLRHGDPFHRYLSGITAWRRWLLSALWHDDPQPKQFWGRVVCRRKGNRYRCRDYGRVHDRVFHGTPGYRWFWGRVACRREGNRCR